MAFTTNRRFSITAFAIAATAVAVLNGGMLMGFDALASNSTSASTHVAKANAAQRTVTLDRVVISSRRA